jgi:uncharacterized repeat protein (TIGR01451 family)
MTMMNISGGMAMTMKQEVIESVYKRMVLLLIMGGLLIALPANVHAAGVEMKSVAEKETIKVDKEGKKVLSYVLAAEVEVYPGDTVRFTNIYVNKGEEAAREGLTIKNPVPKEMAYIGGSAAGKDASITFSVDGGKSFKVPAELFVTGEDGKKRLARAGEYTDIKWVRQTPVSPGEEGRVSYKAKVK